MINMTPQDEKFLRKHLTNLDELMHGTVDNLLSEVYDITIEGLDENDDPTDLYFEAQKVYDSIYLLN